MGVLTLVTNKAISGTHDSTIILVPTNVAPFIQIDFTLNFTDLQDPTKSFAFNLYRSLDTINWEGVVGITNNGERGNSIQPFVSFPSLYIVGYYIKGTLSVTGTITMSISVTY